MGLSKDCREGFLDNEKSVLTVRLWARKPTLPIGPV
jgi:hypothetical protein